MEGEGYMIKSINVAIVVDSVEEAVKFYTEKLPFDIVELEINKDGQPGLAYAHLRKGKGHIIFRTPMVEELAEFSFIKRCTGRSITLFIEIKSGLEKLYDKCKRKDLNIITEIKECPESGHKMFTLKDPFGVKLVFATPSKIIQKPANELLGQPFRMTDASGKQKENEMLVDEIVNKLKEFGLLRRASKKYAKTVLKQMMPKHK